MRHLSRRDLLLPGADEQCRMPKGGGRGGGARLVGRSGSTETRPPPFVLISPDVMCEARFWKLPLKN